MRRSAMVQLTLLPMLAIAATAAADPAPDPEPTPPGMTEPTLSPPGMTPTMTECEADPGNIRCDPEYFADDTCEDALPDDPDCQTDVIGGTWEVGSVVRGGFGHYFWTSGG